MHSIQVKVLADILVYIEDKCGVEVEAKELVEVNGEIKAFIKFKIGRGYPGVPKRVSDVEPPR